MKKTLEKTVLGGLTSLILGSGLAFGEDTKTSEPKAPKGGILSEEAKAKTLEEQEKAAPKKKRSAKIYRVQKSALKPLAEKPKIATKTFVVGPDGKMAEVDPGKAPALDLETLLKGGNQKELEKLLQTQNLAVAGKMVVVDEDGNVTEKELEPGQDLNDLIQGALKAKDFGEIDLSELIGKARVYGVGRPSLIEKNSGNPELKALKADLAKVREEMKAQRELLEKILKKLD